MTRPARWPIVVALMTMAALLGLWLVAIERDQPARESAVSGLRTIELFPIDPARPAEPTGPNASSEPGDTESLEAGESSAPATVPSQTATETAAADETPAGEVPTATPLIELAGAPLDSIVAQAAERAGVPALEVPASDCASVVGAELALSLAAMPQTYRCAAGSVRAAASGRVIMIGGGNEPEPVAAAQVVDERWEWRRGLEFGRFVVIDHGPIGSAQSAISVYSRLGEVDQSLRVGSEIVAGQELATLRPTSAESATTDAEFMWELWVDGDLEPVTFQVEASTALRWATALGAVSSVPVDRECGFPYGVADLLPNSPRPYRSGVHRGVDFNCGRGNNAYAYADGQVVFAISDFDEPTVAQRQATLFNAAVAGSTPHWILAMLYGNFVVIDHGTIDGVGHVVTISAHLDSVDPAISVGATVSAGQRLGEIGNAGTNAGAAGTESTIHLHWELFVDGTHLGSGLGASDTSEVYRSLLCRVPDDLNGC